MPMPATLPRQTYRGYDKRDAIRGTIRGKLANTTTISSEETVRDSEGRLASIREETRIFRRIKTIIDFDFPQKRKTLCVAEVKIFSSIPRVLVGFAFFFFLVPSAWLRSMKNGKLHSHADKQSNKQLCNSGRSSMSDITRNMFRFSYVWSILIGSPATDPICLKRDKSFNGIIIT